MFSTLRTKFGAPGVIATIAIVFALIGGAYAASNPGATGSKVKLVKGPKGAKGDTGAAGPEGAAGKDGTNGKDGKDGILGGNGVDGKDGVSVTGITLEPGEGGCPAGGVEYTSSNSADIVCNGVIGKDGKEGKDGQEGSPWTVGGVLPPEQTETGTYLIGAESGVGLFLGSYAVANISFPIPLAEGLGESGTLYVPAGAPTPANCQNADHSGSANAQNPEAAPGFLCVYEVSREGLEEEFYVFEPGILDSSSEFLFGTGVSGAALIQLVKSPPPGGEPIKEQRAEGTWAVTAPVPSA